MGGACVLDDCVPSKTFIASAGVRVELRPRPPTSACTVDRDAMARRPRRGSTRASRAWRWPSPPTSAPALEREGVRIIRGTRRVRRRAERGAGCTPSRSARPTAAARTLPADVVLVATGATPRVLDDAKPDGERILTWRQVYDLTELPEHLVVVGSGVTGAEFVLGLRRDGRARSRWSPAGTGCCRARTPTPPPCCRTCSLERGVEILAQARAESVRRDGDGVVVTLADGRTVTGSHALMTVGSVPNTADLGLEKVGIETGRGGFIPVDRVSRTTRAGHLRGGRLHRRADARLRRRDAGPDRDVARARRGGRPDQAQDGGGRRVHPAGDRDGRDQPARDRRRRGARPARSCCRSRRTRAPRCRACGGAS